MIDDIPFEQLRRIGLSQHIASQLRTSPSFEAAATSLMRVVEAQRDWFALHDGQDEHRARASPALVQALQAEDTALAIGDWVLAQRHSHGELWMTTRLSPTTQIARRTNEGFRQVLASNVDTALLVMGLDADFNPRRMERYVAMVRASDIAPVAVLTKVDIGTDVHERVAQLRERLSSGVPILAVNGLSPQAREALVPWLQAGQTLVMLGSSGAGKSTLTNALVQQALQDTGGVRKGDGRGRHTTTARTLYRCAEGACIIDTPGLRTWRPDAHEQALASAFEDIDSLAAQCRFSDCRHQGEPGCAVAGHVPPDRLLNYHKLLRDARRGEQTPLERIAQRSKWKALGKAGERRARLKRG